MDAGTGFRWDCFVAPVVSLFRFGVQSDRTETVWSPPGGVGLGGVCELGHANCSLATYRSVTHEDGQWTH